MANHVRQQIREAFATTVTGLTTTGSRVYQSRVQPLEVSKLPCLLISTDKESLSVVDLIANPTLERQVEVTVRAVAKASSNLDDTLDTMAKEVETAINASTAANTLGGVVKDTTLTRIEVDFDGQGDRPVGVLTMVFVVTCYTRAGSPDVSI